MFTWNFLSLALIFSFAFLQSIRWAILPQFMDSYYHLHTAWGFIQAGGYSGWDFWQYAPVGRPNLYPPLFHLLLSGLIKLGINQVIIAKLCESIIPVVFIFAIWYFVKKNFGERLAFFTLLTFSSSYSFYLSLNNHLPATLAIIFGLFSFDRFLNKQNIRAIILLALCFYTHMGVSWVFAFSVLIYGLFNVDFRRSSQIVFFSTIVLCIPILLKQLFGLKYISISPEGERYLCEFKILDYLLAFFSFSFIFKLDRKYRFFISLFLASFVIILYPYRFFSAQGYLPIIFLAAIGLENIYSRFKKKYARYLIILAVSYMLFFTPTILMLKGSFANKASLKLYTWDSALLNMVFPGKNMRLASSSLWFPDEYLKATKIIKDNSEEYDIVYSDLHFIGVGLASLASRPSANGFFSEVPAARVFDPFLASKIVVATNNDNFITKKGILNNYRFEKIAETKFFTFYKNLDNVPKAQIRPASLTFLGVILIAILILLLYKKYLT